MLAVMALAEENALVLENAVGFRAVAPVPVLASRFGAFLLLGCVPGASSAVA